MRIQHNIMAMNAYRNYNTNTSALAKNLEKLSSGYKINRAGDDAAGLAISEKMRAQITGLNAAQKNVKDGISLVKTAEGAMQEIQDMLNRMDYLATQSANGTYDNEVDRANLQKEVNQLLSEINRIADSSNFNGIKLLDGKLGLNERTFSIGSADAVEAKSLDNMITTQMAAAKDLGAATVGTDTILHKDGVAAQAGSFQIDLSQVSFGVKTAGQKADATVTILGKAFDVEADAADTELTGADIADKLKAMFDGSDTGKKLIIANGTASQGAEAATKKGDLIYEATASEDGVLTFTLTGICEADGAITALTDDNLSKLSAAADANVAAGMNIANNVTVAAKTPANSELKGAFNAGNVSTVPTLKPKAGQFGSAAVTFNAAGVKEGMTVTIAGETHTFNDDDIKFSDLDLTTNDGKQRLVERLAKAFENNEHVSVGVPTGSTGKITIAERTDGTGAGATSKASAEMQKAMSTLDGFKGLVSFGEGAKNAGTTITVTDANVKEGDTLTVDGQVYVFADKDTTNIPEGATKVAIKGGAAQNLQKAISGSEINGSTITIRAAKADAKAPSVVGKGLQLQIGDTSDPYNQLQVKVGDMHTAAMGVKGLDISNPENASKAIQTIKNAINYVSSVRGDLGATQNRLEHTANNLSVMAENIQDAESTIRDTDVAEEMMAYTKNNILVQSAQAMLAQANAVPQGVLQLLG